MYYREQLPSGKVVITDDSGRVRIFNNHTDANYWEYNNNPGFSWAKAKRLPELTPKEQIRKMFNDCLDSELGIGYGLGPKAGK